MSDPIFDLKSTHNSHRYHLPVTPPLTVGPVDRPFLFGGIGLGAAIEAMQRTTARPVLWATAQYLSFARTGSVVDFDVHVPIEGRYNSQARVIGHVGDNEILTVSAALGERTGGLEGQWVPVPKVAKPLDCPEVRHWRHAPVGLNPRFEKRLARGRYATGGPIEGGADPEGRMLLWIRSREDQAVGPVMLAIMADFVSEAISNAVGFTAGGNSLDNTIRYVQTVPTEWVLCDMQVKAIHAGTVHTATHLHAEDGTLLATASQSLILRRYDGS